uniref:CD74 molecule n=1 Tax=Pelodiscus sinensis TaxID=13735 RepID=K7G5D8_PELSI|nr:HLA class II histocompatibility antigen gamma chain [Pelodiscus sinensis]|eukprot:XP_014436653.1 HLA class II histocompatibility antigen gamma chain [Pelodiscus sinensis]
MEDEDRRDLISNHEQRPAEGVTAPDSGAQRNYCSRGAVYSAASILVALLIAGQAVTVYFVYQQSGQISKLTRTSQNLQLESLSRKLPQSAKPVSKLRMAKFSMPMVMRELPLAPKVDMTPLEDTAKLSNKTEDQVKHLLLRADPSKMFPELKDSLMENLNRLKNTMTDQDWQSFESWMHKWLLFEMAKKPQTQEPAEIPANEVQSKCQAESSFGGVHPGQFRPQCDEHGDYLPKQCHASTGYCWCVYKNGTKIEGTETREKLDCPATPGGLDAEELMYSGVDLLKLDSDKEAK